MDNQTTHREILKYYQEEENRAEAAFRFARKHDTAAASSRKREWDKAHEILFAVDAALMLYREKTEKENA